jgi:hypothetical protein
MGSLLADDDPIIGAQNDAGNNDCGAVAAAADVADADADVAVAGGDVDVDDGASDPADVDVDVDPAVAGRDSLRVAGSA